MTDAHAWTNTGAKLDSSSAMVRAESDHLDATLHALVNRLSSVPGLKLSVSYRQGRLRRLLGDLPYVGDLRRGSRAIEELVVTAAGCSYWLRRDAGSIRCGRALTSAEQQAAEEDLPFSTWASALFDEIAQQNFVNHDSLVALRHLVEQDRLG
jgi:hypothetical protein